MTARTLGHTMSTLVVQERHLWLCLTDMEQEKVQFLNAPMSQNGLFDDAVDSFAQQFSAAQRQTEANRHIMYRRKPAASFLTAAPSACPSPWAHPLPRCRSSFPPGSVVEPVAGLTPSPSRPPPRFGGKRRCKWP